MVREIQIEISSKDWKNLVKQLLAKQKSSGKEEVSIETDIQIDFENSEIVPTCEKGTQTDEQIVVKQENQEAQPLMKIKVVKPKGIKSRIGLFASVKKQK